MIKKSIKGYKLILSIFCLLIIFLISNSYISFSHAQSNSEPIPISTKFEFLEYSEIEGTKENITSIDIQLPELNWTITNIQINLSDISLGSEINIIEDEETGFEQVWNKNPTFRAFGLGSQLEILELTELFGVFIKGHKTAQANETIKFQIQGFDEGSNCPDGTIYRSIDLNISTNLDWSC